MSALLRLRRSLWAYPIALGVLSVVGLLAALIGDGMWDWVSWVGLGLPTLVCIVFSLGGRRTG